MAIKDDQNIKWPHPLKPNSGNPEQYYHFHRSRGHTTEACKQLNEEVERLIQQGYLGRFVQNKLAGTNIVLAWGQQTQREQRVGHPVVGKIQTIVGGPSLTDQVLITSPGKPAQEKLRLEPITFDDSDLEGVRVPHKYPLVISAGIGEPCYNVKRILIDNGSSVDVLFDSTFLSLRLTREKLQLASGPLYGFVRVEGIINLPVVMGDFPRQITHSVKFIVVKSE